MYQKTVLIGRLGRDPEQRYTQDGVAVTSFSVATDRRWKDAQGQAMAKTTWFRITAWRQLAEVCAQYLRKGAMVMVEGELAEPKPYAAKDGTWKASLDVTANVVKFLDKHEGGETAGHGEIPSSADVADIDIPF